MDEEILTTELDYKTGAPWSIEPSAMMMAHELAMLKDDEPANVAGRAVKTIFPLLLKQMHEESCVRGLPSGDVMFGLTRAMALCLTLMALPCIKEGASLDDALGDISQGIDDDLKHYAATMRPMKREKANG